MSPRRAVNGEPNIKMSAGSLISTEKKVSDVQIKSPIRRIVANIDKSPTYMFSTWKQESDGKLSNSFKNPKSPKPDAKIAPSYRSLIGAGNRKRDIKAVAKEDDNLARKITEDSSSPKASP